MPDDNNVLALVQALTAELKDVRREVAALQSQLSTRSSPDLSKTVVPRCNISGGSVWEPRVGYSRAVKVGRHFFVSGTTASSEGGSCKGLDALAQTRATLATIMKVLQANGACAEHVVRTRMFVVDIAGNADAVGLAHGEIFSTIRPAATMVGVSALIDSDMLVEIEADAIVPV